MRSRRFRSQHTTGVGVFWAFDTIGYKKVLIQLDTILSAIFRFSSAMLGIILAGFVDSVMSFRWDHSLDRDHACWLARFGARSGWKAFTPAATKRVASKRMISTRCPIATGDRCHRQEETSSCHGRDRQSCCWKDFCPPRPGRSQGPGKTAFYDLASNRGDT